MRPAAQAHDISQAYERRAGCGGLQSRQLGQRRSRAGPNMGRVRLVAIVVAGVVLSMGVLEAQVQVPSIADPNPDVARVRSGLLAVLPSPTSLAIRPTTGLASA